MDGIARLFSGMRASSSGLAAERRRIDVIAQNIAHANVTRMPDGSGPYRRQVVHFAPLVEGAGARREAPLAAGGVRVTAVADDRSSPFEEVHDPGHPDADERGMVRMPNVNTLREMADLITAVRAYEANLNAQESFVRMAERALRLAQ
jgi:flagellar basal-body rod protein FlgC